MSTLKLIAIVFIAVTVVGLAQSCKEYKPVGKIENFQIYVDKSKGKTWDFVKIKDCKYIATKGSVYSDGTVAFTYTHCGDCDNPSHGVKK